MVSVALILIFVIHIQRENFFHLTQINFKSVFEMFKFTVLNILTGEGLGRSVTGGLISDQVIRFTLRSIKIILPAFFFSMIIGILLGLFAYRNQSNLFGKLIKNFNLIFSSLPDFFAFILIQYGLLLAIRIGFPQLDLYGHEHWYNTILPIITLSLYPILYMYRITFSKLEAEAVKDYVVTVKSKGKSETYIIFVHLLWNIWGTIFTNTKTVMLYLLTSLPIIELLAFYPGMGYQLLKAIQNQDIMLSIGLLFPFLIMMWITLFISDLASHLLVPFVVGENKSMKPQRIGKLKKPLVSLVTFLWNVVLFIRQYPLFVVSSLLVFFLLYFSFIGPNMDFVDKDLKEFMYKKLENGKIMVPPLPPSHEYWFGTDRNGKDLFSLLVLGAKATLLMVCIITVVRFLMAIPLGYLASRKIGPFSAILKMLQMVFSFFPILFLVMIIMIIPYFMNTDARPYWMIFLIAIVEVGRLGNIYKEEFERIGEQEYVLAGITTGTKGLKLFTNYYFPQMRQQTVVYFTTELGRTLFLLAQLGFVSVFLSHDYVQNDEGQWSYQNTYLSWPIYLSNAIKDIRQAIWIPFFTSLCIAFTIISFTILGEGFRTLFSKKRTRADREKVERWADHFIEGLKEISPQKLFLSTGIAVVLLTASGVFLVQKGYLFGNKDAASGSIAVSEEQLIENISAFSKLYGYVRYFHPSVEASYLGWNRFAIYGVDQVKNAKDEKELKKKLEELFFPIAPTMKLYTRDEKINEPFKDLKLDDPTLRLVTWQHQGLGPDFDPTKFFDKDAIKTPEEELFKSQLVYSNLDQTQTTDLLFETLPKPKEYIDELISENIRAVIPQILYSDKDNVTLGFTEDSRQKFTILIEKLKTIDLKTVDFDDEEVRLADTIIAWNQIQHFYPYFDKDREPWVEELPLALETALKTKNKDEFLPVINQLLIPMNDGQTRIWSEEDEGGGRLVRLPFLAEYIKGDVVVTAADPESEFQKGDIILEKDGINALDAVKKEGSVLSGTTQWKVHRALELFTTGTRGDQVIFKVKRNGLKKRITLFNTKTYQLDEFGRTEEAVKELKIGIYYVNLNQTKMENIVPFLPKLAQAKGVIFDLRGKPDLSTRELLQHYLSEPTEASRFKVAQVIYPNFQYVPSYDETVGQQWLLNPATPKFKGKAVFLSYSGSIADAESYLEFVSANQLGEIVGQTTAGTNGWIHTTKLPGELTFNWTNMKVTHGDGTVSHAQGINPTIAVERTIEGIADGKDEALEKAVKILEN